MNTQAGTRKAKGISIEGFWNQLKDKTAKQGGGTDRIDSHNRDSHSRDSQSRDTHDKVSGHVPKANTDWEARFEDWLDRL